MRSPSPATHILYATIVAAFWLATLPFSHTVALRYSLFVSAFLLILLSRQTVFLHGLPLRAAFLAWGIAALLSLLSAPHPLESLRDIKSELLMGFAAFWLLYNLGLKSRNCDLLIVGLCASLLGGGILSIWQFFPSLPQAPGRYYPGNGVWSTWLVLSLPVLLTCTRITLLPKAVRRLVWFCLICLPVWGFLTFNRGFWIALISVALIFAWREGEHYFARRRFVVQLTLALIPIALLLMLQIHNLRLENAASLPLTVHFDQDPRPALWLQSLRLIADGPITGAGFGQGIYKFELTTRLGNSLLWHGHNLFINTALQMGVPGLFALFWILSAAGRKFSFKSQTAPAAHAIIGTGGLALLSALIVKNFTDDFFIEQNALLFWAMVGLGLGIRSRIETGPEQSGCERQESVIRCLRKPTKCWVLKSPEKALLSTLRRAVFIKE